MQTGRSAEEQFRALGWNTRIIPGLSLQDGIQAVRKTFPRLWISSGCEDFLGAVSQYQREWDDSRKMFTDKPKHDWTSHYADALRYLALVWRQEMAPKDQPAPVFPTQQTFTQLMNMARRRQQSA